MAAEQEQPEQFPEQFSESWPDDPGETQLEHWLQSAYDGPPLRPEFAAALRQQLEQEFFGPRPRNNVALDLSDALAVAPSRSGTVLPTSVAVAPRSKLRLILSLATAAALLAAVSFWNTRPAYGWAEMLRALQQCTWVQAVVTVEDAQTSGWASFDKGVFAVQSDDRTAFRDLRGRVVSDFRANERVIHQRTLERQAPWNWQSLLLAFLAREFDFPKQDLSGALLSAEVVKESWRPVPAKDGHGELIELQVMLRLSDADSRQLELMFLIDPQTHLPVSCRVLGGGEREAVEYEFSYPNEGPETIFALGVPREIEVVTSLALASRPAKLPPRVEATEVIEHLVESQKPDRTTDETADDSPAEHRIASSPAPAMQDSLDQVAALPFDELVARTNTELSTFWKAQAVRPAVVASDEEFVRRVYLDLTGRIPMVSEVYQFMDDTLPKRRERLVDDLLNRRDHATHLAAVWRSMLLPDGMDLSRLGGTAQFDAWLADRFGENMPYDQLVGQLLLAEGRVSESGPLLFYAALKLNPEEIAAKTSRAFLGTRMECAQCHDHPFDEVTQDAFWGYAAFFAQISRPRGKLEMTSPVMRVHDIHSGEVMLPDTDVVVKPRLPDAEADLAEPEAASSRRRQLVDWLTATDNRRFAQATVNRVWEHLFGRGLVNPVDDMRSDNPPICPELLDLLSNDFAANGFDLRRLLRALVLSDAYQLSSRADSDEPSQALCFARMNVKSFTADQLYDCIAVATRNEAMITSGAGESSLARFENPTRQAFIQQFRAPPGERTDYQAGIPQALALMHGTLVHGATDLSTSGLLKSLEAPFFTDEQRIETLFLATLSRQPDPQEREQMLAHVRAAESPTDKSRALGDVLWALVNSAEFTFIH